ncbi:FAD-binding oxidoreductase [Yoonia sp. 208BN28-4]|uniref:FAD-binding oxidoreductase n=1 Tax=Yoonia sp. 208BN28-4 TaxID=3126505 RepID=UPI003096394D
MATKLTLQSIDPVTHDTYHLVFAKPDGFDFKPGQAAGLSLDEKGWRDEDRPFTMTSLPSDPTLEFVIKSYPDHDGVTEKIPNMKIGDQMFLDGPFGAITDHGTGTFIAGGAGITPFIAILKKQMRDGKSGSHLIFANEKDADIIMKPMWDTMEGLTTTYVISDQDDTAHRKGQIDADLLKDVVTNTDQPFYICGPGGMVDQVRDALKDMGVDDDKIITEDGW